MVGTQLLEIKQLADPRLTRNQPMPDLDYLIIAPHPDDAELCVGGTILLLKSEGSQVGVLDLTDGEPTPHGSPEIRQQETAAATAVLGLDWRGNLGLPNRLLQPSLHARGLLAGMLRQLRPRVLLAPYWRMPIRITWLPAKLVDAARFWAKLTKTELPGTPYYPARTIHYYSMHLKQAVQPSFVVDITAQHSKKLEAVRCFHSQFIEGRPTTSPTFMDDVRDRARYWAGPSALATANPYFAENSWACAACATCCDGPANLPCRSSLRVTATARRQGRK